MTDHESSADTQPGDAPFPAPGGSQEEDPKAQGEGIHQGATTPQGDADADADAEPAEAEESAASEAATPPDGETPGGGSDLEDGPADAAEAESTPPPPEPPREDPRLRLLQAEVAKKDELLREYIRAHKKAQTEWDAYRARLKRDEAAHVEAARGKAVEVLLDVGDDMERSLSAARQGGTVESLLEGLELVHRGFFRALGELGLEKHDPTGEPFDPETMEAIGVIPVTDADQDGKVVHTLRIGYRLGERELRPAVVQVGRKA